MFWAVLVGRVLVGLPFLVFGLNHFLKFFDMPPPEFPENAIKFLTALSASGYMDVVKVLEVASGALLLSGRFAPLGLVIATPVAVNIALFDLLLVGKPALGVALAVVCALLVLAHWRHFKGAFAARSQLG